MRWDTLEEWLPSHAGSVSTARKLVRRWSRSQGVPPGRAEEIVLAVSEAATNVVMHAYPLPQARAGFELSGRIDGAGLLVSVHDDGVGPNKPSPNPGSGKGLLVIRSVADRAAIVDAQPGTHVDLWFRVSGLRGRQDSNLRPAD